MTKSYLRYGRYVVSTLGNVGSSPAAAAAREPRNQRMGPYRPSAGLHSVLFAVELEQMA